MASRFIPTLDRAWPALLAALLAGCASTDPLRREGLWRPNGANEAGLVVAVETPGDLVAGRADPGADASAAARAVARWRADRVKPLPNSGFARVVLTPSGDVAAPPAPDEDAP